MRFVGTASHSAGPYAISRHRTEKSVLEPHSEREEIVLFSYLISGPRVPARTPPTAATPLQNSGSAIDEVSTGHCVPRA
eukprot:1334327-Rhodomonas_salina.1